MGEKLGERGFSPVGAVRKYHGLYDERLRRMVEGRTVVRIPNSRSTLDKYTRYMHGISLVHLRGLPALGPR